MEPPPCGRAVSSRRRVDIVDLAADVLLEIRSQVVGKESTVIRFCNASRNCGRRRNIGQSRNFGSVGFLGSGTAPTPHLERCPFYPISLLAVTKPARRPVKGERSSPRSGSVDGPHRAPVTLAHLEMRTSSLSCRVPDAQNLHLITHTVVHDIGIVDDDEPSHILLLGSPARIGPIFQGFDRTPNE